MFFKKSHQNKEDHPVIRLCPVCGKHTFSEPFEKCPICNWENEYVQENIPSMRNGVNEMSLDEARKAYAEGRKIN